MEGRNNMKKIAKIDLSKIRGRWHELRDDGFTSGGDDTVESIKLVAEKVNEIIDLLSEE